MFFFAHGLKIRSFQGVPESCRRQSCRGIPACMRRIGYRIVAPWVKTGLLHCRSDSCLRCGMRRMAAAHRTFRHGAAGGAQGQIAHLLPGSKQNLQKEGVRPVETAAREGMRHFPKRPGATGKHWRRIPAESLPAGFRRMQGSREPLSPARLQKRKEGPLSESLHLSDQSGMRITSWIYAHRAVRRAGPCCGSRYGRCRTGA